MNVLVSFSFDQAVRLLVLFVIHAFALFEPRHVVKKYRVLMRKLINRLCLSSKVSRFRFHGIFVLECCFVPYVRLVNDNHRRTKFNYYHCAYSHSIPADPGMSLYQGIFLSTPERDNQEIYL